MDPRAALEGIPLPARKVIYTTLGVLTTLYLGAAAFYGASDAYASPDWFAGAGAALAALSGTGFWIATANTKVAAPPDTDAPQVFEEVGSPESDPVL